MDNQETRFRFNRKFVADPESLAKVFWKRVLVGQPNECWLWHSNYKQGYGCVTHKGQTYRAHRVAYVLTFGEPEGMLVIGHKCDNKRCCNPSHLEAITHSQNCRDASTRNLIPRFKGETNPCSVLTESQVLEIKERIRNGESLRSVGRRFGVSHTTARHAAIGKNWAYLKHQSA